jgi:hypothetical protein
MFAEELVDKQGIFYFFIFFYFYFLLNQKFI